MPDKPNPGSAAARLGSGNVCFDGERFPDSSSLQKTQVKLQDDPADAEFDAEIARALVASGWRATAYLLINAAFLIESGDYLNAERNGQSARQQFVVANDAFRQLLEARGTEAVALYAAEAFR